MEKQLYLRIIRRIFTVLVVLILLVACSAQVSANEIFDADRDSLTLAADMTFPAYNMFM